MEEIQAYLESLGETGEILEKHLAGFRKNADIAAEFERWVKSGEFADEVAVEGYTASRIKAMAEFMNGAGVYNFLITLRERPEVGKRLVKEGFVRR